MILLVAQLGFPVMVRPTTVGNVLNNKSTCFSPQFGLAYLGVLFLVAAIAISVAVVSQNQDTVLKREKEQDWLFVGKQYAQAIASYYHQSPNGIKSLPSGIQDLLLDKRFVAPVRHLRKPYIDPLTNQAWVLIKNPENKLLGVYSALGQPILSIKIIEQYQDKQEDIITQYSDVKFEFKESELDAQDNDLTEDNQQLTQDLTGSDAELNDTDLGASDSVNNREEP